jgi:hypothetical protein
MNTRIPVRPNTADEWHDVLIQHLGHELMLRSRVAAPAIAVVHSVSAVHETASMWLRDASLDETAARWVPEKNVMRFFGVRTVGCRTCQLPLADAKR